MAAPPNRRSQPSSASLPTTEPATVNALAVPRLRQKKTIAIVKTRGIRLCLWYSMLLAVCYQAASAPHLFDKSLFNQWLHAAEEWWHALAASKRVVRESIHEERAERARHIFFRYRDKDFSFTDCTSFALMRELRIREALTTDKHFRQAGFQMLPR